MREEEEISCEEVGEDKRKMGWEAIFTAHMRDRDRDQKKKSFMEGTSEKGEKRKRRNNEEVWI